MVDAAAMIATRSLTWRVVRQLSEQQVDLLIAIGLPQRKQRLLLSKMRRSSFRAAPSL